MKRYFWVVFFASTFLQVQALTVSEVLSNPTGDDSGREWVEIYNEGSTDVDLSAMTISIKGGNAVVATPLQGGTNLAPGAYAVIGSTVSGSTKFLQDYPNYTGILFKSSISLVNTGVTSIDVKLNGSVVASLPSYTAAKEGLTLSYIGGSYVPGNPTPGAENQVVDTSAGSGGGGGGTATATTTDTQVTVAQLTPPSSDIVVYLPSEKVVVAGAEADFNVFSQTRAGKAINDLLYTWAFGDGGQATGSSTKHRYEYSGRYILQVDAVSSTAVGSGRMVVRVVAPDIFIVGEGTSKYGSYVDIKNPNTYDLDLSKWMLTIDSAAYPFPKNTWLPSGETVRFSGNAMGFASTTLSTSTIKILFPSLEEVTRYAPETKEALVTAATSAPIMQIQKKVLATVNKPKMVLGVSTTTLALATSTKATSSGPAHSSKDTRIVSWLRNLLGGK